MWYFGNWTCSLFTNVTWFGYWSSNSFKHSPLHCHPRLREFPSAALTEGKQQNPHGPDWVRRNADSAVECKKLSTGLWDSVCSTLKALQPNDMPLAPFLSLSLLPPLATSVFLSLCPSVYSGWGFFSPISSILFHPSPPTYKTSFYCRTKAAMYFFVSCLFPHLAHVLAVCRPPCFNIRPTSLQSSSRLQ